MESLKGQLESSTKKGNSNFLPSLIQKAVGLMVVAVGMVTRGEEFWYRSPNKEDVWAREILPLFFLCFSLQFSSLFLEEKTKGNTLIFSIAVSFPFFPCHPKGKWVKWLSGNFSSFHYLFVNKRVATPTKLKLEHQIYKRKGKKSVQKNNILTSVGESMYHLLNPNTK